MATSADRLRSLKTFEDLTGYLEDELGWELQGYDFDQLTFEYQPSELGLKDEDAVKVRRIHQLRPLEPGQPWGIFFVEFEKKKLPVVVLRRILSHLVIKKRADANRAKAAAWQPDDLLFISAFGEQTAAEREIAFAHFHQETGDLPTLRVLGWDGGDTPLKLDYVAATLKSKLQWPDDPADHAAWRKQWSSAFRHRIGHTIRTADALAEKLAELARNIRDAAQTIIQHESERGPLRQLHQAFRTALIHDLTEADFADTYAQTITYGLLTAAISRTDKHGRSYASTLLAEDVVSLVPVTSPFLKEMLETFLKFGGRKGGIDFDELGIQDVVDLLRDDNKTDLPAILRDFGNKTRGEDPVIHFYEHFLSAYNKKLKVQRGVFYTPQPVVSYIVRSVHELLQTEFGLQDGLADTITWGEFISRQQSHDPQSTQRIPEGVASDSPFVQILDPATGTATFLVEVIEVINCTLTEKWKRQGLNESQRHAAWNEYVPKHLLPRLHGYELMMAPYAIAHLKLPIKLKETGFTAWDKLGKNDRARIYLTNALEPASDEKKQMEFAEWAPALAHEAAAVNEIKRHKRFTVVIGNPPYSKSMSKHPWSLALVEEFKAGLDEKKSDLTREEWKFLSFAFFNTKRALGGVTGLVINNAFLSAPTHRGIRRFLLKSSSKLDILDLHGDSRKGESAPDGSFDENVFEIQQGVCVMVATSAFAAQGTGSLGKADIYGTKEHKYDQLTLLTTGKTKFDRISPAAPFLFFRRLQGVGCSYSDWISITDVFLNSNTGIQTKNDDLFADTSLSNLNCRMKDVLENLALNRPMICQKYGLKDSAGWRVAQLDGIRFDSGAIRPFLYKPFDYRFIYYHTKALGRARHSTMRHMLQPNLALIATRQVTRLPFCHAFVSRWPIEEKTGSHDRTTQLFPLYLYSDHEQLDLEHRGSHRVNAFTPAFASKFASALKVTINSSGKIPADNTVSPVDVFSYIYCILHSPTYREDFSQELMGDFPRLPLTGSLELFRALAQLGGELVALHLLESPRLDQPITEFIGSRDPVVEKVSWARDTVWVDKAQTMGFRGVREAVWKFHIGGFQVCEKWLKDRKGRTLTKDDIAHYHKIVVALTETIRLMAEIDQVIEKHGGWPGAFATAESASPTAATEGTLPFA